MERTVRGEVAVAVKRTQHMNEVQDENVDMKWLRRTKRCQIVTYSVKRGRVIT